MGIGTCDIRIQVAEFTVVSFCVAGVDVACFRRMKGSDTLLATIVGHSDETKWNGVVTWRKRGINRETCLR